MMKQEFDQLVGITTAPEAWERIEFVYMNDEEFKTKQQIAEFYKKQDMNGIEKKREEIIYKIHNEEEFEDFLFSLAYFSRDLNSHIKQHLAETMYSIYKDKTIVTILNQYRIRTEEELQEQVKNFEYFTRNAIEPLWDNHCLTNANHYRTVIEDLTYTNWWHEHSKDFK